MGLYWRMMAWFVVTAGVAGAAGGCQILSGLDDIAASASGAGGSASTGSATGGGAGGDATGANSSSSSSGAGGAVACSIDCLGGECIDGECAPYLINEVAAGQKLDTVAIDPVTQDVYVSSRQGGTKSIYKFAYMTGQPEFILFNASPFGLAVDAIYVYWFDNAMTQVMRAFKQVNAMPALFKDEDGSYGSSELPTLLPAGPFLYWRTTASKGKVAWANRADLMSFGTVSTEESMNPSMLAADGSHVFWHGNARVRRAAMGAMEAEDVGVSTSTAYGMAVDESYVYFTDPVEGKLGRVLKDPGDPPMLRPIENVIEGADSPSEIAVQGNYVYFVDNADDCATSGSALWRVHKSTKEAANIVQIEACASNLAHDDVSLYWASGERIYRLATLL